MSLTKNKCLIIIALCLTGPSPANAQERLSENTFFGDVPMVLSATRLSAPRSEIPAAVTVIDRRMIEASGALEVAELFRLVPGIQIAKYTGSKYSISFHGNADQFARDMQVLIDGRSIYDPGFGGVTWSDQELDVDDIERIEVVRGPNAASYGSNAFSGVINIVTQHAAQTQGGMVKVTVGEGQTRQIYSRWGGQTDDLDYRLSVKYDENTGYENRHDSANTAWLNFRGDYQVNSSDSLLMELGMSRGDRQEGFPNDTDQPERTPYDQHHYQHLRWTRNFANDEQLYLQFYRNYQSIDDRFVGFDPILPGVPLQLGYGFASLRYDLELQHQLRLNQARRLVWGVGARLDKTKGADVFTRPEWLERYQARAFANLEWHLNDALLLNLGGMLEQYQQTPLLFSPRAALNYKVDDRHSFRLIANRAYRMPTIWEEYAHQQVYLANSLTPILAVYRNDRDVKPEQMTAYELGYLGQFPASGLSLDVRVFREEITNLVSEITEGGTFKYFNDGYYNVQGWEMGLKWESDHSLFHLAFGRANPSGLQLKKSPVVVPLNDIRTLRFNAPQITMSLLASHEFDNGIRLSSAFYYMDENNWPADGDFILLQRRWDLSVGKSFKLNNGSADISLILQNIGSDNDYQDFYTENVWTDRAFLQAEINWH